MKILYGNDITEDIFEKIADLDAEVFKADGEEFGGDTTMSRDAVISLLKKSAQSTVVVLDDEGSAIGYFQTFAMKKDFEEKYIKGEVSFHDLDGSKLLDYSEKSINLYLWTIALKKEYRGKLFPDPSDPTRQISVAQMMHEGLIDALVDLKKQGCSVEYIFGEGVSEKGVKTVQRFCGKDSLIHSDKENEFYMYGSSFDVNCEAFAKCKNVSSLKRAYGVELQRSVLSENTKILSDSSKLDQLKNCYFV